MTRRSSLSKFQRTGDAIAQPEPQGSLPNRALAVAAVADPYGLERKRRVRVVVNLDTLDRLLWRRRISVGEHAAGRAYQRLVEISLGGSALDGDGVRNASNDDIAARAMKRAAQVVEELARVRAIVGARSERLLYRVLVEINSNTGRAWTLEEIAELDGGGKHRIFALSQRFADALADLAVFWSRVVLE